MKNFNFITCGLITLFIMSFFANVFADNGTDTSGVTTILCQVINLITGGIGQAIAMLMLISLGVGLFLGKVTWGVALCFIVGLALMFSSGPLIAFIASAQGGTQTTTCSSTSS
jgi:type IV secretory pathway VirB2 component (pilin)